MTMEVSEKPDEENPSRVEEKGEILEVGKEGGEEEERGNEEKDVDEHGDEEKEVEGREAGGDEVNKEEAEENAGEDEEVKEEKEENHPDEEEEAEDGNEENGSEDEKQTEDEKTPTTSEKKGSRKEKKREAEELQSPRAGIDRPSRERKTVERYIVPETARNPSGRPVSIGKGRGTQLKDIPNVAFKLSKRKADENLQLLHTILFGKKAKVQSVKKNIGLFSGFVWIESEQEKQRSKIKEKLEKCVKGKLFDFCDILNIPVNKTTTKKEELSAKLLEFLESPHATTDTVLAEKEKSKKRGSKGSASKSPGSAVTDGGTAKKRKLDPESGKHSSGEDGKSESSKSEDDQHDEEARGAGSDTEESEKNEDQDEPEEKKLDVEAKTSTKQKSAAVKSKPVHKETSSKASKSAVKLVDKSSGSSSKKCTPASESNGKSQVPPTKKQKVETDSSSKKKNSSVLKKEKGDGKSRKVAKKEPTRSELSAEVVNILKQVDFNTATLSDILKQLGDHFKVDLMDRKREIKEIITQVIQSMSDEDEDETTDSGNRKQDEDE